MGSRSCGNISESKCKTTLLYKIHTRKYTQAFEKYMTKHIGHPSRSLMIHEDPNRKYRIQRNRSVNIPDVTFVEIRSEHIMVLCLLGKCLCADGLNPWSRRIRILWSWIKEWEVAFLFWALLKSYLPNHNTSVPSFRFRLRHTRSKRSRGNVSVICVSSICRFSDNKFVQWHAACCDLEESTLRPCTGGVG